MKRHILLGIACITSLLLTSCASTSSRYYNAQVRNDLSQENWVHHINLNPNVWTSCADKWFFTDEPKNFDEFETKAPASSAITAMVVRVPDFTNITVDGPYKVQIYGRQLHNSVYVLGPNDEARHTSIEIQGNTLHIHPATECTSGCGNQNNVIVRIGIHDLNGLSANGTGLIEGKEITSNGLNIKSTNSNNVLLTGNLQLNSITQTGVGTVSVIGAYSPTVDIRALGNGNVNVSGRIGIRYIMKQGAGFLNIIGADTDGLDLYSYGSGMTRIAGNVNLRKIDAYNNSRVYIYWVTSNGIYANIHDSARVGLAGAANNIDAEVSSNARFEGKYLRTNNVYVRTRGYSHANVNAVQKLFSNAMDNSSIYFFGSPNVVSRYTTSNGIVIPVFDDACPIPGAPQPVANRATFKDEAPFRSYKDETAFSHSSWTKHKHRHNYKNEKAYR